MWSMKLGFCLTLLIWLKQKIGLLLIVRNHVVFYRMRYHFSYWRAFFSISLYLSTNQKMVGNSVYCCLHYNYLCVSTLCFYKTFLKYCWSTVSSLEADRVLWWHAVKVSQIWCLAYGEKVTFIGVWPPSNHPVLSWFSFDILCLIPNLNNFFPDNERVWNVRKLCRSFGEMLLRAGEGKFRYNEFMMAWKQCLPPGNLRWI